MFIKCNKVFVLPEPDGPIIKLAMYNCDKFDHCGISRTDFRYKGLFAPPHPSQASPSGSSPNKAHPE